MKIGKRLLWIFVATLLVAAALPLCVVNGYTPTDNLLYGKSVGISGNGVGAWDQANNGVSYRANLTDGVIADGMNWVNDEWFGFYYGTESALINTVRGVGVATVDLDGAYSLSKIAVHVFAGDVSSGITAPVITAYYSMDEGESYLPAKGNFVAVAEGSSFWAEMSLSNTKATHVKFEFTIQSGSFIMIDELAAYGDATTISPEEVVVGAATVDEKEALRLAVEAANKISYKSYGETALNNIRECYDQAIIMLEGNTATKAECNQQASNLLALLEIKANILSVNKSYQATPGTRGDNWDDDGVRLTDGQKGTFDGGYGNSYAGWKEETTVVIDLGSVMQSDTYSVYLAAGTWGIALPMPKSFTINISYSLDGDQYTAVNATPEFAHTGGSTAYNDGDDAIWGTFHAVTRLEAPVSARYVKFDIINEECVGFIWTDEIEVALGETSLSGGIYVTGLNKKIENGSCVIFTNSFNQGVIDVEAAGISWTNNVIAKWNEEKQKYLITSIFHSNGAETPSVTLADDEILIAAHAWDGQVEAPVVGSGNNVKQVYNARIGDAVIFNGIDIAKEYCTVAPFIKFSAAEEVQPIDYYHIDVRGATCTDGSYCATCGNILSDPLGHRDVTPATCTEGDYCNNCETTIGECLGHDDGEWSTLEDGSMELRCTRCGHLLDTRPAPQIIIYYGLRGDVNFNDKIDARDYLLLKRGYFGTYAFNEEATYRADINENDAVDARDYLLLKRAYFNTYEIPNPYIYVEIVVEQAEIVIG